MADAAADALPLSVADGLSPLPFSHPSATIDAIGSNSHPTRLHIIFGTPSSPGLRSPVLVRAVGVHRARRRSLARARCRAKPVGRIREAARRQCTRHGKPRPILRRPATSCPDRLRVHTSLDADVPVRTDASSGFAHLRAASPMQLLDSKVATPRRPQGERHEQASFCIGRGSLGRAPGARRHHLLRDARILLGRVCPRACSRWIRPVSRRRARASRTRGAPWVE